jgi:hypothetical protein
MMGQIALALYHSRRPTAAARREREVERVLSSTNRGPLRASPAVQYNPPHYTGRGKKNEHLMRMSEQHSYR